MNQVILVGRLTKEPEYVTYENDKKRMVIILAVSRPYKNGDGIYQTDFIRCVLWNGIAKNTSQYCHKGDVVGVKGRLECNIYQNKEQQKQFSLDVIAEKVTYLSSSKNTEKEL